MMASCKKDPEMPGDMSNHEYVDLGLPSGLLWATCNVGASSPEDYGGYFAWGETTIKSTYNWSTYKWCNGDWDNLMLTRYNTVSYYGTVDNRTILELADDAAHVNWGGAWRMPTREERDELFANCTSEWTTQNGVNGRKFTGPNGNSIFLPAAGCYYYGSLYGAGSYGYYWSSSLCTGTPGDAYHLGFYSGYVGVNGSYRYCGQSVRPVCPSQK